MAEAATPAVAAAAGAGGVSGGGGGGGGGPSPFGPDPGEDLLQCGDALAPKAMALLTDTSTLALRPPVALALVRRAIAVHRYVTAAVAAQQLHSGVPAAAAAAMSGAVAAQTRAVRDAMVSPHRWVCVLADDLIPPRWRGTTSAAASLHGGTLRTPAQLFKEFWGAAHIRLMFIPAEDERARRLKECALLSLVLRCILALRVVTATDAGYGATAEQQHNWTAAADKALEQAGGRILRLDTPCVPDKNGLLDPPFVQLTYACVPLATVALDLPAAYGLDPSACSPKESSAFYWAAQKGEPELCVRLAACCTDAALDAAAEASWPLLCRVVFELHNCKASEMHSAYERILRLCCSHAVVHDDGSGLQLFTTDCGETAYDYAQRLRRRARAAAADASPYHLKACDTAIALLDAARVRLELFSAGTTDALRAVLGGTKGALTQCVSAVPLPDPLLALIHGYVVSQIPARQPEGTHMDPPSYAAEKTAQELKRHAVVVELAQELDMMCPVVRRALEKAEWSKARAADLLVAHGGALADEVRAAELRAKQQADAARAAVAAVAVAAAAAGAAGAAAAAAATSMDALSHIADPL